jgi:serine/threonine protein kinase
MKLYSEGNLRDYVKLPLKNSTKRILTGTEKINISIDILKGLENLHSIGCIHRDLKPANILLDRSKNKITAAIGDLGLSKF